MPQFTTEQVTASLNQVRAVGEAIRDIGSIPSGHLYAALMGAMDLESYQAIIRILVRCDLVEEGPDYMLRWTGPEKH